MTMSHSEYVLLENAEQKDSRLPVIAFPKIRKYSEIPKKLTVS